LNGKKIKKGQKGQYIADFSSLNDGVALAWITFHVLCQPSVGLIGNPFGRKEWLAGKECG